MARRSGMDICHDILKVAEQGAKKTRLVYQANLNFRIVKKYLNLLLERGLIEHKNGHYFTTDEGSYWMTNYSNVVAPMKDIMSQLEAPQM